MFSFTKQRTARRFRRIGVAIVRSNTAKPLRRRLSRSTDQQLDRALSAADLRRGDLFTPFKGNAAHRKRLASMMARFRIDPQLASEAFWPELQAADSVCADCPNVRRCVRLLQECSGDDWARVLCPTFRLFGEMAMVDRAVRAVLAVRPGMTARDALAVVRKLPAD